QSVAKCAARALLGMARAHKGLRPRRKEMVISQRGLGSLNGFVSLNSENFYQADIALQPTGNVEDMTAPKYYLFGSIDPRIVLLVDDQPDVLAMIQLVLKRAGLSVLTAKSPSEAFTLWHSNKEQIQLLITDVELGTAMTGCDLANELRKEKPKLKVIL